MSIWSPRSICAVLEGIINLNFANNQVKIQHMGDIDCLGVCG